MPHKSFTNNQKTNQAQYEMAGSNQFHNRFYRRAKREITSRVRRDLRQSALGWNSPSSQHQYINNMKSNNLDPNSEHTSTNKERPNYYSRINSISSHRDRRRNKFTSYSEFMRSNQNNNKNALFEAEQDFRIYQRIYIRKVKTYVRQNFYKSDEEFQREICMCPMDSQKVKSSRFTSSLETESVNVNSLALPTSNGMGVNSRRKGNRNKDPRTQKKMKKEDASNPLVILKKERARQNEKISQWKDAYGRRRRNKNLHLPKCPNNQLMNKSTMDAMAILLALNIDKNLFMDDLNPSLNDLILEQTDQNSLMNQKVSEFL